MFTVTSFQSNNNSVLTINGDAAGDNVVLNFTSSVNFNSQVVLVGISPDQVLYNFVGGSNLSNGPALQIGSAPGSPPIAVQGDFLDPNGSISLNNTTLTGRVFGGGGNGLQIGSGTTITAPHPGIVSSGASCQVFNAIATPTFCGVATSNAQVAVLEDGMIIGTALVNSQGNWSFTCPTLTTGQHHFSFEAVNALGTFSAVACPTTIQV